MAFKLGVVLSVFFVLVDSLSIKLPPPSCPYGPCEVPQCCNNGIAVRVANIHFNAMKKCPDRGCFSCLSQQYLLGIHERCSLDHSLMKSLCAPGLSCMIYCASSVEGVESCWNKYGTCQYNHIPALANERFPGNVTVIPGLTKNDAKRAPLCSRERTICTCRGETCESKGSETPWCFLSNIKNPAHPTQSCYRDVRWSSTYGSFYSSEACTRKIREIEMRRKIPVSQVQYRASDDLANDVPILNNFDDIANNLDAAQDDVLNNEPEIAGDDFYWNFEDDSMKHEGAAPVPQPPAPSPVAPNSSGPVVTPMTTDAKSTNPPALNSVPITEAPAAPPAPQQNPGKIEASALLGATAPPPPANPTNA